MKRYRDQSVLEAARERIRIVFDNFSRIYVALSGGKDSSVQMHLVMDEAIKRNKKVAVMFIDFEAQYEETIRHLKELFDLYADYIEPHWICIPMLLRNAVSNYEPRWMCWDPDKQDLWIREKPSWCKTEADYPFALPGMEFEEFIVLFGEWYGQGELTAGFIGIRAQESLHRYCAIATWEKRDLTFHGHLWTTKIIDQVYNIYPIYDWLTEDIWRYNAMTKNPYNHIYDKMQMAGVPLSQQRLCQPFGDDQRRGLWLYHILEPQTWFKLIARVNGANSGALYIEDTGNINGYNKITKPPQHTWRSFCNLLLQTMPKKTRDHYVPRFKKFIHGWHNRGYVNGIPDEAPPELESKCWAPSWRRMCKVLLRNDWHCGGLGQGQPKSEAYKKFKEMRAEKRKLAAAEKQSKPSKLSSSRRSSP